MSLIRDIAVFLCGFLMVKITVAQVTIPGACPNVSVVQDFQAEKYLGKWYEEEKYFAIFELGGKCISATYTDLGNNVIGVNNKQINILKNNAISSVNGTARLVSPPEAKLEVTFPQSPFPAAYWVLDTDYTSYSVVWGCKNLEIFHLSFAWILTRDQHPSSSVLDKAFAAIDKNGIEKQHFIKTDQTTCPEDF